MEPALVLAARRQLEYSVTIPAVSLSVLCVDQDQRAVGEVAVSLTHSPGPERVPLPRSPAIRRGRTATTDKNGRATFDRIAVGRWTLSVQSAGDAGCIGVLDIEVLEGDGPVKNVDFSVTRGLFVAGTVVSGSGTPGSLPRIQVQTYHGVLAPSSSWRDEVVPKVDRSSIGHEDGSPAEQEPGGAQRPPHRYLWAELMRRVFGWTSCSVDSVAPIAD